MYVARIGDQHILKRMPESGPKHASSCDSYEAPYELSGFGHVAGTAIQEDIEEGVTRLKLDFSLSKTGPRSAPTQTEESDAGGVATDGSKLSLRSLLHYLWDQAEFNRWRPGMAGKRNWPVIRKFLAQAAEGKTTKGRSLLDVLYIPEMFHSEREAEITQRRITFMNRIATTEGNRRSLLVLIGEVKEIASARFGHRIVVKHLPKFPFMLNEDVHRRLSSKFANELTLWDAMPDAHLIAIATFGLGTNGVASVEAIAVMVVDEHHEALLAADEERWRTVAEPLDGFRQGQARGPNVAEGDPARIERPRRHRNRSRVWSRSTGAIVAASSRSHS